MQHHSRWYQNRWPWIILGMLGGTVVLCIHLIVLSIKTQDYLVVDNYYDAGKGINRSLEREQLALELGLRAEVFLHERSGEVRVQLNQAGAEAVELNLISPTRPEQDLHIVLRSGGQPQSYLGQLAKTVSGRRFVELVGHQGSDKKQWRLFEEEQIVPGKSLLLGDEPLAGAAAPAP